jgi:hypothetical protein
MSFQVPPAIAGIIIGAIMVIIGVVVLNGSQFIPQVWSIAWVGVILIVTLNHFQSNCSNIDMF